MNTRNIAVSGHALARYLERSHTATVEKGLKRIFGFLEKAVRIAPQLWYADGWILAIRHRTVRTVFRPRTKRQQELVYQACREHGL